MENRIGLSQEGTKKVAEHMNTYLANLHVLYTASTTIECCRTRILTLHAKLEELYDGVAEEIDAPLKEFL